MKLSELKIETYSDQLNKKELTEVKGGTWHICVGVVVAAALLASGCSSGSETTCVSVTTTTCCDNGDGTQDCNTETTTECK